MKVPSFDGSFFFYIYSLIYSLYFFLCMQHLDSQDHPSMRSRCIIILYSIIAVQFFRKDKASSEIFIRPFDSISEVKQKIKAELLYNSSRLLLNDQLLQNILLDSETPLSSDSLVRAVKGKQNLKKRRVTKGPGSIECRRLRKREAQEQFDIILTSISSEERQTLSKILNEDHEEATENKVLSEDVRIEEINVGNEVLSTNV